MCLEREGDEDGRNGVMIKTDVDAPKECLHALKRSRFFRRNQNE